MKMVIPSLFLRSVIAVLAAIGISIVGNAAELPGRIVDIVSWAVVLALPAVVISLWILLTALRVKRRSIKNKIEGCDGDRLLWRASLLGYAGAAIVGGIGVFYFPNAF